MNARLPLLPTSVVGSHGLPGWVWLAREAMEQDRLGAVDVGELMEEPRSSRSRTRSAPASTS